MRRSKQTESKNTLRQNINGIGLVATRRRETAEGLPGIVDPPLETRQRTDHENTRTETVPAALPAEHLHRLEHVDLLSRVVHLRHA